MTGRVTLKLVLIVVVCYGVYYRFVPGDGSLIEITPRMTDEIAGQQEALVGRPLSKSERDAAVDRFIEEDVLVREAFRRGLDRGDRRVRPMLIAHARSVLSRAAAFEPPDASDRELRTYFDRHAERYRVPERIDLSQVLFLAGDVPEALDTVLAELRGGADFTAMGAAGPGANAREVSRPEMAQAYGLDFTNQVFALAEGEWQGPFVSPVGTHFVRIEARQPSRERTYEEVEQYVGQDYRSAAEARLVERALDRVRRRYRVDIEHGE